IAVETSGIRKQKRSHAVSALGENTRGNKTVASIVAGPRNDCDVNAGGMTGSDRLGHGAAGVFHELDPGDAPRDGAAVRLSHLGGGGQIQDGGAEECRPLARAAPPPIPRSPPAILP